MSPLTARNVELTPYKRTTGPDGGAVLVHRLRAEKALGKPLPDGAEVHHADGTKDEDAPLVICQDRSYHMLLHYRMEVLAAGGDPNVQRLCSRCKKTKPFDEFYETDQRSTLGLMRRCKECIAQTRKPRTEEQKQRRRLRGVA